MSDESVKPAETPETIEPAEPVESVAAASETPVAEAPGSVTEAETTVAAEPVSEAPTAPTAVAEEAVTETVEETPTATEEPGAEMTAPAPVVEEAPPAAAKPARAKAAKEAPAPPPAPTEPDVIDFGDKKPAVRGRRKLRVGKVISSKMQKTVVVAVETRVRHPLYGKFMRRTAKFKAHDEESVCGEGDTVEIMETRPLSKDKRWRVVKIVEKAK
jgi:small subunit ribosomal protein S17